MPSSQAAAIYAEIEKLTPPQRLRLAADLLEQKRADIAHPIVERVSLELGAVMALAAVPRG